MLVVNVIKLNSYKNIIYESYDKKSESESESDPFLGNLNLWIKKVNLDKYG